MTRASTIMAAVMVATSGAVVHAEATPGPGASLAWTSKDPVVVQARELILAGSLGKADALLAAAPKADTQEAATAREETRETIRRIRHDFNLSLDALLAKVKKQIPNVTAADIERWREQGLVKSREIDGKIIYFGREPAHLFLFCDEAKRMRDEQAPKPASKEPAKLTDEQRLHAHVKKVIAAAKETGKDQVEPVRTHVNFKLTVKPDRPGAKAGSLVRCWLPFPQEYRQQRDIKMIRTSPAEHVIAPSAVDGTYVSGSPHRTVYLEQKIDDPAKPVVFQEEFEYTSYAYYPNISEELAKPGAPSVDPLYLAERPPHIVFTPELKALVDKIVGDEKNPLARARRIFAWASENIRWCPEMEYAIIPSFTEKILKYHHGDCGVQSTLFITMCRYAGIPARWQSGWQTKPDDWNMHDWAEFYIEPWGWLPVDATNGLQKSDDPAVRDYFLGHQDAYRLIVNLDYGAPLNPPKPSMRSEPADFQRGEVELDGRNLYFDEWGYEIKFDWQPKEY